MCDMGIQSIEYEPEFGPTLTHAQGMDVDLGTTDQLRKFGGLRTHINILRSIRKASCSWNEAMFGLVKDDNLPTNQNH